MGYVYVIVSPNCEGIYVGSSKVKPSERLKQHRQDAKRFQNHSSKKIIDAGDAVLNVIEQVDDNRDLHFREQFYMDKYKNEIVNIKNAVADGETIVCDCGGHYQNTSKAKGQHFKTKKHKSWEQEKQSDEPYQNGLGKFTCPCGGTYDTNHRQRHFNTTKHINWLQALMPQQQLDGCDPTLET